MKRIKERVQERGERRKGGERKGVWWERLARRVKEKKMKIGFGRRNGGEGRQQFGGPK